MSRICCVEGNRLVYYDSFADSEFWDNHWHVTDADRRWKRAAGGWIARHYDRTFERYLPRNGRILEAGCGLGHVVMGLRSRGFEVEGVDYAANTIARTKLAYPELPLRAGDVCRLEVPDGYYAGYISLGVMEHFHEGPAEILKEARRVLMPGGALLASVPHFNALRRLVVRTRDASGKFYQYAYTAKEFRGLIVDAGFEIVDTSYYDVTETITNHLPASRRLFRIRGVERSLTTGLSLLPPVWRALAHMVMVVARSRS